MTDTISLLNLYVQKLTHEDPCYLLSRDGSNQPPTFIGTLSAPTFLTVAVLPGAGLPSKKLLRDKLANQFILVNKIQLRPYVAFQDAFRSFPENTLRNVMESPPTLQRFESLLRFVITHMPTNVPTSVIHNALLAQKFDHPISYDRCINTLFKLEREGVLLLNQNFGVDFADSDAYRWTYKNSNPAALSFRPEPFVKCLLRCDDLPVPYELQYNQHQKPMQPMFYTSRAPTCWRSQSFEGKFPKVFVTEFGTLLVEASCDWDTSFAGVRGTHAMFRFCVLKTTGAYTVRSLYTIVPIGLPNLPVFPDEQVSMATSNFFRSMLEFINRFDELAAGKELTTLAEALLK